MRRIEGLSIRPLNRSAILPTRLSTISASTACWLTGTNGVRGHWRAETITLSSCTRSASCRPASHLAAGARVEEDLSERLCQNGLELWHDCLDLRGDHVGFEGSLVGPAFEGKKTPWLADHFHQRVDQATGFFGRLLGEGHEQRA